VADIKSESRPASDRYRWPASFRNAWPASSESARWRMSRIPGHEFMRRFLQHVLPKGLHKVRYFGLWHPAKREDAARARLLLLLDSQEKARPHEMSADAAAPSADPAKPDGPRVCPCCRKGLLLFVRKLSPKQAQGP